MITLKPVTERADIEALSEMASQIWHEFFPGIISVEQIEYMLEKFLSPDVLEEEIKEGYELFHIVDDAGEKVGFTLIQPDPETGRVFLSKIYLTKENRKKGYSSQVFKILEDTARLHGMKSIWLTVNKYNDAFEVYKHRGFTVIDEVETDIGSGYIMDDFILEKFLTNA